MLSLTWRPSSGGLKQQGAIRFWDSRKHAIPCWLGQSLVVLRFTDSRKIFVLLKVSVSLRCHQIEHCLFWFVLLLLQIFSDYISHVSQHSFLRSLLGNRRLLFSNESNLSVPFDLSIRIINLITRILRPHWWWVGRKSVLNQCGVIHGKIIRLVRSTRSCQ